MKTSSQWQRLSKMTIKEHKIEPLTLVHRKKKVIHPKTGNIIPNNPNKLVGVGYTSYEILNRKMIITNQFANRLALMVKRDTRFVLLEGPARSSKTALGIQAFYYAMLRGEDIRIGLIASKDNDTLMNNILQAEVIGFLTTHPECTMETAEIGGYYINMPTATQGVKKILITGYDNESRWKKVLGGSIDIALLDEANIANPTFIREVFTRQIASNSPLTIFTTNGDNPDNMIYQEYGNYAKPIGLLPATTLALINEFQTKHINDDGTIENTGLKSGYYYMFFQMKDNPIMTPDKLKNAKSLFPKGSYYYTTKILGERSVQGVMIFVDYLDENKTLVSKAPFEITRFTIGFDIGATKAYSVITLTGWNKDFSKCCILRVDSFNTQGYEAKKMHLRNFLNMIDANERPLIESISIDSAESNFITDIQPIIKREYGLLVIPSYKATIKERIDMIIVGLASGRLTMLKPHAIKVYDAYRTSKWEDGNIGQVREDLGLEINDIMDSVEYSMTSRMKTFLRGG